MAEDALELIRLRNNFYRDNYRRALGTLLLMIIINITLVGVVFYQATHKPPPQYFATTVDGRIMPLYPLSEPMLPPSELLQWASRATIATYTYNFVNYREALQKVQNNFTSEGWVFFENALKEARTLETVIAKKLVVSATPTAAPTILDQGVIKGRYSWKVKMPMLVTYQSPNEQTQQPVDVTMVISRVPAANTPRGIAIESFVVAIGQATS